MKVLAFVLPQFHRIPENDGWWGTGFTEWTKVKGARPLFHGHAQPRIPAADNYYNLLDPAVQDWQARLAIAHGLHGFCYYHYWFKGKLLLQKPVEQLIERGAPDIPFCLAWANEPWTRTWDGGDSDVLMPQDYGEIEDWDRHFHYLLRAFKDPRYIRVGGKPMLLIYRSLSIPSCREMLARWRSLAVENGLDGLHVVSMLTFFESDPRADLFDAFCEYEPMYTLTRLTLKDRVVEKVAKYLAQAQQRVLGASYWAVDSRSYRMLWRRIVERELPLRHYPGAFVDWDNSPRKGSNRSLVMRHVSVRCFERSFAAQCRKAQSVGAEFMFVNAWNEWAEGTYLEPDARRGTEFLEAIARTLGVVPIPVTLPETKETWGFDQS